jgi:hypothetical protein
LATGDSYKSLSYSFRVGVTTVCNIIRETCSELWSNLLERVLKVPTQGELLKISKNFGTKWSLPNCVGAIDGKHIIIQAPYNSGSLFFNYKKTFSIVLLAVCDDKYFFTYVDIGAHGSESDGGVLNKSTFGRKLLDNSLNLPPPQELPNSRDGMEIPMFFVGDEAFPLRVNLMRPFSKPRIGALNEEEKIFNYRLSRARRMIENTFGIMVARFRVFHRVINAAPATIDKIVKAAVCVHNFISEGNQLYFQKEDVDRDINGVFLPGRWRNEVPQDGLGLTNLTLRLGARNAASEALNMRNYIKAYVNGPGAYLAPWQYDNINRLN